MNISINTMLKTLIASIAIAFAFAATPALADCMKDIESVKTIAPDAALSDKDKEKVEMATKAAAEKQAVGDEDGCVAELMVAKTILKIQ